MTKTCNIIDRRQTTNAITLGYKSTVHETNYSSTTKENNTELYTINSTIHSSVYRANRNHFTAQYPDNLSRLESNIVALHCQEEYTLSDFQGC